MTEQEYLQAADVFAALHPHRTVSGARRWRCFAVACCRRAWPLLPECSRPLVEVVERLLEGRSQDFERAAFWRRTPQPGAADLEWAAWKTASPSNRIQGVGRYDVASHALRAIGQAWSEAERDAASAYLADVVRDIFGNPFRPTPAVERSWLAWNDATALKLALGVSDDQAFDRLPILADALEDAGCTSADLLEHLRGPGPHVRGCWALDLVLGKR